jgi:hypothetical protein
MDRTNEERSSSPALSVTCDGGWRVVAPPEELLCVHRANGRLLQQPDYICREYAERKCFLGCNCPPRAVTVLPLDEPILSNPVSTAPRANANRACRLAVKVSLLRHSTLSASGGAPWVAFRRTQLRTLSERS